MKQIAAELKRKGRYLSDISEDFLTRKDSHDRCIVMFYKIRARLTRVQILNLKT
jgi:hypothetical protein